MIRNLLIRRSVSHQPIDTNYRILVLSSAVIHHPDGKKTIEKSTKDLIADQTHVLSEGVEIGGFLD